MFGLPSENPEKALDLLSRGGFTHITLPLKENLIKLALDHGFKVFIVFKAFDISNKRGEPSLLAEDPYGRKHVWFSSGCPNNPLLREERLEKLKEIATKYDIHGISLDGIRFASPGSGINAFMTCFCRNCKYKAEELGYNYWRMKKDVERLHKSLQNPSFIEYLKKTVNDFSMLIDFLLDYEGVLEWLSFRAECIAEYVKETRNLLKSIDPKLELGAYLFTPTLSKLVGQDYRRLAWYLDVFQPMIYRLGEGVACYNYELAVCAKDISELSGSAVSDILLLLYRLCGLDTLSPPLKLEDLFEKGLPLEAIHVESTKALRLAESSRVEPIIILKDPQVVFAAQKVIEAGCSGVNFFIYTNKLHETVEKLCEVVKTL